MQPIRIMMRGTNTTTAPTPGMIPSTSRLDSSPGGRWAAARSCRAAKPLVIQAWGYWPRVKVRVYIAAMMAVKQGMPSHLWVRMRSSWVVQPRWASWSCLSTSLTRPWANP